MVESLNTKVDLSIDATSFMGLSEYGKIMVGDHAFEFYNNRSAEKYIQIPWEEVDVVIASVMFGGKWIPPLRHSYKEKRDLYFLIKRTEKSLASDSRVYPRRTLGSLLVFLPSYQTRCESQIRRQQIAACFF